ncbi:OmpA family protein [uncultured Treponema sp.]|uniref:OmpA family protein n=1 Tax=uncultured Treponema sp. TaxID=162155 RepID=UPI0025F778D0|nr:OmpA family protein [uncultured Treponema sp.]
MKKFAIFIGIFSFISGFAFSQTKITYSGDSGYSLVERTNLRRYINGKYSGLTSREVRSFISRANAPKGMRSSEKDRWYDGNFFVLEETLRDTHATMAGIHDTIPSVFKISTDGKMSMIEDNGYPTFRGFPSYPADELKSGDSWTGQAERAVDPMNKGIFTRMPVLVRYTFADSEVYKGEDVYRIKAIWQTNYPASSYGADPRGDSTLKKGIGSHKADIIVRKATGEAILISDLVDETFAYADGTQVNLKGTITMFTEYPPAIDRDKLIFALNRIAKAEEPPAKPAVKTEVAGTAIASVKETAPSAPNFGFGESPAIAKAPEANSSGTGSTLSEKISSASGNSSSGNDKNNMVFEETPAGIRLSVRDIKFKADSDDIVESEGARIDEIAEVLKLAPNSQFLIEGHTAATGRPDGEYKLSVLRAKKIAAELSKRGISADKFICKGHGGNKPIASNSTNSGKAQNRRVEITILE